MRGTTSRAGGTSMAWPASTKARCMSTTRSAVRPGSRGSTRGRLFAVHSNYQAETENAFGMWRIALTAPSSLKITETTSNRQETCRSRLSLR